MIDSARRLGDVVGEGAAGAAEPVVEVDAGGEGEQALKDPRAEVSQCAGAVAFEREQVFGGPEDRLDALADGLDVWAGLGFIGASGADQRGAEVVEGSGELTAGVALI